MKVSRRTAIVFGAACAGAAGASAALRPTQRASEIFSPIQLETQVPLKMGVWQVDRSIVPLVPDPGTQAALEKLYSQSLARTYIDDRGQRVMLCIAYGSDQGNDATAAHRPEFCYSAQGFAVQPLGVHQLDISGHPLIVRRVIGTLQSRREPISYWVTLNDRAVLPGVTRKLEQIRLGLFGQIPDGMLVRVSTVSGTDEVGFAAQQRFLVAMRQALPGPLAARYFGS